jgi:integrase
MGRKNTGIPGLLKRGKIWHIDKRVRGQRLCQSSGSSEFEEAQRFLIRTLEMHRQATVYGVRPSRTFDQAAARFIQEHLHKRSLSDDVAHLKKVMPYIGDLNLEAVHRGALQRFIEIRTQEGVKAQTINHCLQIIRRILHLAATEWIDEYGLSWLQTAPNIKPLPITDLRKPYPLNWSEQERLFSYLPAHLKAMALFAVNTGCRDQEICHLRWDWEVKSALPQGGSVFVIPATRVKNGEDRLVILNQEASAVIERQRGKHPLWVFAYKNKPLTRMHNRGWQQARLKAGLLQIRVHDLKHTLGRRLRAAGVSFEDRQDLLGHKSSRITTHYSAAELRNLWRAANAVCSQKYKTRNALLKASVCAFKTQPTLPQ